MKLTKNLDEANLITHSGTFHADDIFACLILSKVIDDIKLIRLQEFKENPRDDQIVFDIGGGKFDHHQLGGNGERINGIKYAACGLIWKEYGRTLLAKYNVDDIEYAFRFIDRNLIQFIDSNDNGQLPKLEVNYRNVHLAYIIGMFNQKWDEKIDNDECFLKAYLLAEIIFDEFLKDTISKLKAKSKVDLAIENSEKGILILEDFVPWKEFLLESNNAKAKDINYAIFPSKRGGFNVYAVPEQIGSFLNRKSLPKEWRGLQNEDLQKATGVETARFCHNAGFIITCETKEDAIKLALNANNN